MSVLPNLWHAVVAHPVPYAVTALVALGAFIKRKMIGAASTASWKWIKGKFFGWLSENLPGQSPIHEKTYKGTFHGFQQYSNYPHECFFTVTNKGVTTSVPTMRTNLLSSVREGALVEIDTEILPHYKVEVVRRVRVIEPAK